MILTEQRATETLARYIVEADYDDLPMGVVEKAKQCILDSLACSLGGVRTQTGGIILDLMKHLGGKPEATIFGWAEKTSCVHASFANASIVNILDYDDTYSGHPGATTIPPAINVAEEIDASGKDLITAIVLGYETSIRICDAIRPSVERKHIHGHGTWQTFGAVTVASKLLNLNLEETMGALGIAGSNAPVSSVMKTVLNQNGLPTMVKNNYGIAAEVGVLAARLARSGFSGPHDILDGDNGFWRMCGSDRCDFTRIVRKLGEDYEIMKVSFKPYPSCRFIHSAIDAMLNARRDYELNIDSIDKITLRVPAHTAVWPFTNQRPMNMVEAQFSIPYAIAVAVSGKLPGPEWFTNEALNDPQILRLAAKVTLVSDEQATKAVRSDPSNVLTTLDVHALGKTHSIKVDIPKGDPRNPMTEQERKDKFRRLASIVLDSSSVEEIMRNVENLEKRNANDLSRLLAANSSPHI